MASNPFPDSSARHVPDGLAVSPRKFSRLQTSSPPMMRRPGIDGKKTAETCPNMTVFTHVRESDGTRIADLKFSGRSVRSLIKGKRVEIHFTNRRKT